MKTFLLIVLLLVVAAGFLGWRMFKQITVFDFQKGLRYRNGAFDTVLGPGTYRFLQYTTAIEVHDCRRTMISVAGQEILTKDKVGIKLSMTGNYEISDPLKAKTSSTYYVGAFYNDVQMLLRDAVSALDLEELLEQRSQLDASILKAAQDKGKTYGLNVTDIAVRDIILPANLKRAYAGVLEAQKEAQKQLEKARGEQAVLRSLANSSKMYDNNPSLMQARIVQALADGKNTIVFNSDGRTIVPDNSKP